MRCVCGVLGLTLLLVPAPRVPAAAPPSDTEVLERFAVHGDGDLLILPVTIKRKTYPFVLDTGCTGTIFDSSLVSLLGPRMASRDVQGEIATVRMDFYQPPEACVGRIPLPNEELVAVHDLASMRAASGSEIRGVLGLDFLLLYVIDIDFDAGTLTFQKRIGEKKGYSLPFVLDDDDSLIYVKANVGGRGAPEPFLVDTGMFGEVSLDLQEGLFRRLKGKGKITNAGQCRACSLGHESDLGLGHLNEFSVGPFTHRHLIVSPSRQNTLALAFLSRYHVTFDFPGKRIYLRKGKRFDLPDKTNRSGLLIHRPDAETVVAAVRPGSPGDKEGVKAGDIVLSIGELDAQRTRLSTLHRRLTRSGENLPIVLRRGSAVHHLSLQLEGKPEPAMQSEHKP